MNVKEAKRLRARWRGWIGRLDSEVTELVIARHIFREVADIVRSNPRVQRPSDLHAWIAHNYFDSVAMAIRKLTEFGPHLDKGKKSIASLGQLIDQMQRNPGAITRRSHHHFWRRATGLPKYVRVRAVNEAFDAEAGSGKPSIPAGVMKKDLASLRRVGARAKRLVDKRIAHLDRANKPFKSPSTADLDAAIDAIERIFLRYKLLLTCAAPSTLLPTWAYDWKQVFRSAWITQSKHSH